MQPRCFCPGSWPGHAPHYCHRDTSVWTEAGHLQAVEPGQARPHRSWWGQPCQVFRTGMQSAQNADPQEPESYLPQHKDLSGVSGHLPSIFRGRRGPTGQPGCLWVCVCVTLWVAARVSLRVGLRSSPNCQHASCSVLRPGGGRTHRQVRFPAGSHGVWCVWGGGEPGRDTVGPRVCTG